MVRPDSQLRVVGSDDDTDAPGPSLAIDDVFRRYAPYVASIGLRMLGRYDEVDDLVQDVFMDAYRALTELRHAGAIKAWLTTLTVRKATRRLRARRLKALFWLDEQVDYQDVAGPSADPTVRVQLARVYACLDRVPAKQRVAWLLRHVEGERLEHVAQHCGCSLATAKRRIQAAQRTLERKLRS